MTQKLILFSGPPRSGKDTAADILADQFSAWTFKFSAPIKAAIRSAFDLCNNEVDYLESIKSEPTVIFDNLSYRQVQISFSEDWLKPTFGADIFGRLATRHLRGVIREHPEQVLYVSSDSGFQAEALPLVEMFEPQNCLLVRVYRDGCTFDGDSRSYYDLADVPIVSLTNNDTMEQYQESVCKLAYDFLTSSSPF